ncbi:MAG: outer membrane protein assembly factor BamB [Xanthomonadaceae bacterium]|jgi:outer membrane protein assembly factor BamB|nr:outer membrane protein assembly factor BamB [Xanthomonadaceae bacterium]
MGLKGVATAVALMIVLAGCSTVKGRSGGKNDDAKKAAEPAALVDFTPSVTVSRIWTANAGKGEGRMGLRQGPAVLDGKVYAAAVEGGVRVFDLHTGKSIWQYRPGRKSSLRLSGGPSVGDGLVVIGGLDGDVVALDAVNGTEKWRARVTNEVIAPPLITQGLVFVRSNDGRVTAFDAATGKRQWFNTQEMPTLTVRGNAGMVAGPGFVFVGNDDGSVSALAMQDGRPLWEQAVGQTEGRTELERMSDVDSTPVLEGTTIYASSYRNQTMAIDGPSGRPIWQSAHGGVGGLAVSSGNVLLSDNGGTVYALDKINGAASWSQPALARRSLTGPAVHGDFAVVADYKGYLHWLNLNNGEFAARARAGGSPIRAQPVVADGILVVQNVEGKLTAFRLQH